MLFINANLQESAVFYPHYVTRILIIPIFFQMPRHMLPWPKPTMYVHMHVCILFEINWKGGLLTMVVDKA